MEDIRSYNVGKSNYAEHKIQPWDIWLEYDLNPWDADIIKCVLRTKEGTPRKEEYEKIIHICKERIRQLEINVERSDGYVIQKQSRDGKVTDITDEVSPELKIPDCY